MSVPTFQEMMLPFLSLLGNGQEHTGKEVIARMIEQFSLSEEEA